MNATYRAIEISEPGVFTEVSRPLQEPGPNQVRIRVEACGVCHTDSLLVDGALPNLIYPRVPGHEVIGRIEAVARMLRPVPSVSEWVLGSVVDGTTPASHAFEETLSTALMVCSPAS